MASRVKPSRRKGKRKPLSDKTDMVVSRVLVITAAQVAAQLQEDHGFTDDEASAFLAKLKRRLDDYGRQLADLHHELELLSPTADSATTDAGAPVDTSIPTDPADATAA